MPFSFTISSISSRNSNQHSYHPVPAPDEETLLASPRKEETGAASSEHKFILKLSFWLTTFAVLSVAVTIRNLFVVQLTLQELHVGHVEASIGSPYNGLEKLVRNESSPSWPLSSAHYPDFIGATKGPYIHRGLSNGSIVRLDSEHSIIIQHRVRDYGLEYCSVELELSGPAENAQGDLTRGYAHTGESPCLRLNRLEDIGIRAVLAPSALPASLPSRKEFLGDIVPDGLHSMQSPSFQCNMGSIQTLEISVACASDPCIMEFGLTQLPPQRGFWVVQREGKFTPV